MMQAEVYSGGSRHFVGGIDEPVSYEGKDLCPECKENWKQARSAMCLLCHLLRATQLREDRRQVKHQARVAMQRYLAWLAEQGRQRPEHVLWLKKQK